MKNLSLIFCILSFIIQIYTSAYAENIIDTKPSVNSELNAIRSSIMNLKSEDSVNKKLLKCMEVNTDTLGIGNCYSNAYQEYNKLLNLSYKLASDSLDDNSKELLRLSQRKWISFRDEENKLYKMGWANQGGSVIGIAIYRHQLEMLRERIAELTLYAHFEEQ